MVSQGETSGHHELSLVAERQGYTCRQVVSLTAPPLLAPGLPLKVISGVNSQDPSPLFCPITSSHQAPVHPPPKPSPSPLVPSHTTPHNVWNGPGRLQGTAVHSRHRRRGKSPCSLPPARRRNHSNTSQDSVTGLLLAGIGVRSEPLSPLPPRRTTCQGEVQNGINRSSADTPDYSM